MDINKANLQDIYALSPMQQGMLFHALYEPDSQAYFEQMRYDVEGELNIEIFKQSWQILHNRHDVLRTVFVYNKSSKLLQMVLKHRDIQFNYMDISALAIAQQSDQINQYRLQDRARGFDLAKDHLSRVQLFKTDVDSYVMIWSVHHIILDAWCFGIIYRELISCYQSLLHHQLSTLPPAPPYSRYIKWLALQDVNAASDYWRNYLQGYDVAVGLYAQQQHSDRYCYARQKHYLNSGDSSQLKAVAQNAGITLNTAIQSAWALLLSAHNSCNDIVFGMTVSGRPAEIVNVENTLGLFINTVPLRIVIDKQVSLLEFWQQVQQQALSTESYHYYSLADIQSQTELKQNLLNHVLVFENIPQADTEDQGNAFVIKPTDMFEHPHYPFMLSINPDSLIEFTMIYDQSVYSDNKIERVAEQLIHLLEQMALQPNCHIADLTILPKKQQSQILNDFSLTNTTPDNKLIVDLFSKQLPESSTRLAIIDATQSLSYRQLNSLSNRFAHYLLNHYDLKAEDKVAILLPRNINLLVALWGILKAGAAYVPLDNGYPKARIDYILQHSLATLIVTDTVAWSVPSLTVADALSGCDIDSDPDIKITAQQLAYLIYTSGSTGQPKGVMVEHGNIAAFCKNLQQRFNFSDQDKLLALTTISFDISILELLCSFTVGMQVVIANDLQVQNPEEVLRLIQTQAITVLQATPSRLQWLINANGLAPLSSLRIILVGGEALPESLAQQLKQLPNTMIINVYGPTEATIWSTCHTLGNSQLTIGTALLDEDVYILSPDRNLQAVGVTGEIFITGAGVSRGYWQDSERTLKAFTADPFKPQQRMYATGDLGRWLENGEIECLGRNDDQIKIRGFRIELGEIERHTQQHPAVAKAAVVNSGNTQHSILSAFIVPVSLEHTTETLTIDLRKYLAEWLPEFMIPTRFIATNDLPLNSNGKVDRKALIRTLGELTEAMRPHRAARDDFEQQVVELWQQVLLHRPIGIDDDFFSLGGNSINAIGLVTQLSKLYGRDISLSVFWANPSISALTEALSYNQNTVMIKLNERENAEVVFCFPPITGFGAVFIGLAEQLSWSCYSFDIVANNDWLAYIITAIKQVQPKGPYKLLGYSAGGNYAYTVATALESQGECVQALILIDSTRITSATILNEEEKQDIIDLALKESQLLSDQDQKQLSKKMSAYLDFILQHPNQYELTANLFYLSAQNSESLALLGNNFSNDWSSATHGKLTVHECIGNHFQVLVPPQLTYNAKIIQGILDKL